MILGVILGRWPDENPRKAIMISRARGNVLDVLMRPSADHARLIVLTFIHGLRKNKGGIDVQNERRSQRRRPPELSKLVEGTALHPRQGCH